MTASLTLHETVANHGARIKAAEKRVEGLEKKLDRIFWAVISTLVTVLLGLVFKGRM